MKIISMYLPQYHRVHENDMWWGEGFTDWDTVRRAKPLLEGHQQPKVPLHDNYYDLLDKSVMQWQAQLMHRYGIDAQCIYHYWFKDGRQILEKPAENLLKWKDIDMPFCFCWANETWARSWSNLRYANIWANGFEPDRRDDACENGILLKQDYGDADAWKRHFEYLLPFFQDERYLKQENKPIFLFYKTNQIPCFKDMIGFWRKMAIENGFDGMYIIAANCDEDQESYIDLKLIHEPQWELMRFGKTKSAGINPLGYREVWENLLKHHVNARTTVGGFVNYDDTPRRGSKGTVIETGTLEQFESYLTKLMKKNKVTGYTFLNAWNEWGEGMYLEPDSNVGFGYLEAVSNAKRNCNNEWRNESDEIAVEDLPIPTEKDKSDIRERERKNLLALDQWLYVSEMGMNISQYLKKHRVGEVAIYGYGLLGRHVYHELRQEKFPVRYLIDITNHAIEADIPAFSPEEELPQVELIIVSSVNGYLDIADTLSKKNMKFVSLMEILRELKSDDDL